MSLVPYADQGVDPDSDTIRAVQTAAIRCLLAIDDRRFVEFLVRTYDQPMGVATYRTAKEMPERLRRALPDMERMKQLMSEEDKD